MTFGTIVELIVKEYTKPVAAKKMNHYILSYARYIKDYKWISQTKDIF